ncbi:MAG: hypothetical protein HY718_00480, partial [Planctomycetes bacterium]|nr:hypothetical protein [Planctomycetota bacterium]
PVTGADPTVKGVVPVPFSPRGGDLLATVAVLENIDAFADITASADIEGWILARFGNVAGDVLAGVASPIDTLSAVDGRGDIRDGGDITAGADITGNIGAGGVSTALIRGGTPTAATTDGGGSILTKIIAGFNQVTEGQAAFDPLGAAAAPILPGGPADFSEDPAPPFGGPPATFNLNNFGSSVVPHNALRYFSTGRPEDTVTGTSDTALDFAAGLTVSGTILGDGTGDDVETFIFAIPVAGTLVVDVDANITPNAGNPGDDVNASLQLFQATAGVGGFLGFADVNGLTTVTEGEALTGTDGVDNDGDGAIDELDEQVQDAFGRWNLTLVGGAPTIYVLVLRDVNPAIGANSYTLNIEFSPSSGTSDNPLGGRITSSQISADTDLGSGGTETGIVSVTTDLRTGEDVITTDLGFAGDGTLTGDDLIRASERITALVRAGDDIFSAVVSGVNSEGNFGEDPDATDTEDNDEDDITGNISANTAALASAGSQLLGGLFGDVVSGDDISGTITGEVIIGSEGTFTTGTVYDDGFGGGENPSGDNLRVDIYATGASPGDIVGDILSATDISATDIDAGAGTGGNIQGSIIAGDADLDGDPADLTTTGAGSILDVWIMADENIGPVGVGANNLPGIIDTDVIGAADDIGAGTVRTATLPKTSVVGADPVTILAGLAPANGTTGTATTLGIGNILVNITAGPGAALSSGGDNILNTIIAADGQIGFALLGLLPQNAITAASSIGQDNVAASATDPTSNFNVFINAGFGDDVVDGGAPAPTTPVFLGDGFSVTGAFNPGVAGTGVLAGTAGTAGDAASKSILVNITAAAGSIIDTGIFADDSIGLVTEGNTTILAGTSILGGGFTTAGIFTDDNATVIDAGNNDSPNGSILADVISGFTDGTATTVTTGLVIPVPGTAGDAGDIARVQISADDDIGVAAQASAQQGLIVAANDIFDTEIEAGAGRQVLTSVITGGATTFPARTSLGTAGGNVFVDIIAGHVSGQGSIRETSPADAFHMRIEADTDIGGGTEGINTIRAADDILGISGDVVEILAGRNILSDIIAGFSDNAATTSSANAAAPGPETGDIAFTNIFAGTAIGSTGQAAGNGLIIADDDIFNVSIFAGSIAPAGAGAGTPGTGGDADGDNEDILVNIIAGGGADDDGSIFTTSIQADDNVGESTDEGINLIRADDNIGGAGAGLPNGVANATAGTAGYDVVVEAGNATDANGGVFSDVVAGFSVLGVITGSIIDTLISADDNIGTTGQDAASTLTTTTGTGKIIAATNIQSTTIRAGSGTQGLSRSAGGNILVSVIAGANNAGSIIGVSTSTTEPTRIEADDDIGEAALSETATTNVITAANNIGQNNTGANTANNTAGPDGVAGTADDVLPTGFDVFIDAGNVTSAGGNIFSDIIAGTSTVNSTLDEIEDVLISADDDIGIATQAEVSSTGVIRADDDINNVVIQAGGGTQGRGTGTTGASPGGNVFFNIIAGFDQSTADGDAGDIDPTIIEADDDVGSSPEGTNLIFAFGNIGIDNGTANTAPVDNPDPSSMSGFDVFIDAGNSGSPGGNVFSDILAGNSSTTAPAGSIVDTAVTADDDIGSTGTSTLSGLSDVIDSDGLGLADNPNGIIQGWVNIGGSGVNATVVIIAGDDLGGRNTADDDGASGDRLLVDILAVTGSIQDTLIAADDDAGQGESALPGSQTTIAPEGANVVMAGGNIGDGSAVNFGIASNVAIDKSVVIQAGNTQDIDGNVFYDVVAINGQINQVQVQAEDNVGAFGQLERDLANEQVIVFTHTRTDGVSFLVGPDQLDSDGFITAAGGGDDPHGIIQAGSDVIGLTVLAGEISTGSTAKTTTEADGGSILVSIISGGDPDIDPSISGLIVRADDDAGDPGRTDASTATFGRQGNVIVAPDDIHIEELTAGANTDTFGNDIDNTESGFGGTALDSNGDLSFDIIAGSILMTPSNVTIPSPADSNLPFAFNINDGLIPTLGHAFTPPGWTGGQIRGMAPGDDDITIEELNVSADGLFIPDDPATPVVDDPSDPGANEGNGNFNGTFVAADDLTLEDAIVNGNFLGDDGAKGRTLVAGASPLGSDPGILDIDLTVRGDFQSSLAAGLFVPFNTDSSTTIGPNVGPFQAGTVITLGEITGSLSAGRIDGSHNGIVGTNGITLREALSGLEGLADQSYLGTTTFSATQDMDLSITATGRPFFPPQGATGAEVPDFGDGDIVNLSVLAFRNVGGNITVEDAMHLNFILSNVDAITAIDSSAGDPSTPSTLLPLNNGLTGDVEGNITAFGNGNGININDNDGLHGISGGVIGAGFDPFALMSTTGGLPANAPAGSVTQGSLMTSYANAFGLGSIDGDIRADDQDATDGFEQGDITLAWIAAGQNIDGDIEALDDLMLGNTLVEVTGINASGVYTLSTVADDTDGSGTFGAAAIPGVDMDIAAGLSANSFFGPFATAGAGSSTTGIAPGGNLNGNIVAGDDIFSPDSTGDDMVDLTGDGLDNDGNGVVDDSGEVFGLLSIWAQGGGEDGNDTGNINGDIVSGAEDQVDDLTANADPDGGLGGNMHVLVLASSNINGDLLVGDPFNAFELGGGASSTTGSSTGNFVGTIVSGGGLDLLVDNANVNSAVNQDNNLGNGNFSDLFADSNVTLADLPLTQAGVTLTGLTALGNIN